MFILMNSSKAGVWMDGWINCYSWTLYWIKIKCLWIRIGSHNAASKKNV